MPTEIRKAMFTAFGDPSVVKVVDATLEDPPKDHVQVKVLYSGFSGSDTNMRLGIYPLQKEAPLTPGYCLVGEVYQNGPGSARFSKGDLVAALTVYDAEATYANVAEKHLLSLPQGIDLQAACALILDWNTAYGMVMRAAKVSKGDKVFVHGMSGAVGFALFTLCQMQGATVYGTASERNHKAIRELGGIPFVYTNKDWINEMKKINGVQAVFDPLGFTSWDESYSILSTSGGTLVGYGGNAVSLNGEAPRSTVWAVTKLLAQNLKLCHRRTTFYYIDRNQKTFKPEFEELVRLLQNGEINVRIKQVYPLEDVRRAHEEWTSMQGMGSILVKVH